MQTTSRIPSSIRRKSTKTRIGSITLILTTLLAIGVPTSILQANPYGSYGGGGGRGYYQPQCGGWSENCNRGGWLGTGVPNGLGWTLFGLSAAAAISRPTYVAPAPVIVEQPVYVQQPVVVTRPQVVQAPLVNCNGVPCYYINGNYYPATAMQ
jgi:hypothetical protein